MTQVQIDALEEIRKGKKFNGKLYGDSVYIGGQKYQVAGKKGKATVDTFFAEAKNTTTATTTTFDTGLGYYGTSKDMRRGYDGIESEI